ncbi:MAG: hypothetical protein L6R35_000818 [Caloplaca aegaea]|nr:MAG: hypothetical protein L6R35_000818 [Caloplaca aegaea]
MLVGSSLQLWRTTRRKPGPLRPDDRRRSTPPVLSSSPNVCAHSQGLGSSTWRTSRTMLRSNILRKTLCIAVSLALLPTVTAECYSPNGTDRNFALSSDIYQACDGGNKHSMCCRKGHRSMSPRCCFNAQANEIRRGRCTEPMWQSPECIKLCIMGNRRIEDSAERNYDVAMSDERITECKDGTFCCGAGPTATTCCKQGNGVRNPNRIITRRQPSQTTPRRIRSSSSSSSSSESSPSTPISQTPRPSSSSSSSTTATTRSPLSSSSLSSPSTNTTTSSQQSSFPSSNTGPIIGAVLGGFLLFLLLSSFLISLLLRRRRRRRLRCLHGEKQDDDRVPLFSGLLSFWDDWRQRRRRRRWRKRVHHHHNRGTTQEQDHNNNNVGDSIVILDVEGSTPSVPSEMEMRMGMGRGKEVREEEWIGGRVRPPETAVWVDRRRMAVMQMGF